MKELLKHLMIYFVFSFTHHTSHPVIHRLSWSEITLSVSVGVCVCFVSLLYESCKMANIHFAL